MGKIHIKNVKNGDVLNLNLNYKVSRFQFDNDLEPVNIVSVTCKVKEDNTKVFVTVDGEEHNPTEFQYDYKGYFYKNEDDLVLWTY